MSPFVLVRLLNVRKNVPISIECKAYDKNITIKTTDRIGYVQFELMIEHEEQGAYVFVNNVNRIDENMNSLDDIDY